MTKEQKSFEQRVRRLATRLDHRVHKSREDYHLNNRGEYMLLNDRNCVVLGADYEATLPVIESYLRDQRKG